MADWELGAGTVGYEQDFTLNDEAGDPFNLAGYTVTVYVWTPNGTLLFSGGCTVSAAADGEIYYTLVDGDVDAEGGIYRFYFLLTKTGVVRPTNVYTMLIKEGKP